MTPEWLENARATLKYHIAQQRLNEQKWTLTKTAKALRRSYGSVCEDVLLAKWSKTYDLEQFEFAFEALNFIRMKKKERELED